MTNFNIGRDLIIPLTSVPDFKSRLDPKLLDDANNVAMYSHEHAAIPVYPMVLEDGTLDEVSYYGVMKCTQEFYDREIKQFEVDGWVYPAGTITRHKFAD